MPSKSKYLKAIQSFLHNWDMAFMLGKSGPEQSRSFSVNRKWHQCPLVVLVEAYLGAWFQSHEYHFYFIDN